MEFIERQYLSSGEGYRLFQYPLQEPDGSLALGLEFDFFSKKKEWTIKLFSFESTKDKILFGIERRNMIFYP